MRCIHHVDGEIIFSRYASPPDSIAEAMLRGDIFCMHRMVQRVRRENEVWGKCQQCNASCWRSERLPPAARVSCPDCAIRAVPDAEAKPTDAGDPDLSLTPEGEAALESCGGARGGNIVGGGP